MSLKKLLSSDPSYRPAASGFTMGDGISALLLYACVLAAYLISGVLDRKYSLSLAVLVNLTLIAVTIVLTHLRHDRVSSIGLTFRKFGKSLLCGFVMGAVALTVNIIGAIISGRSVADLAVIIYNLFFYFIAIALSEEIVFRGYIQTRLYSLIKSDTPAVIACGLMFGVMHIPYQMGIRGVDLFTFLKTEYWLVIIPFLWHFALNLLYRKFNSLAAPVIFHGFLNFSGSLFQ